MCFASASKASNQLTHIQQQQQQQLAHIHCGNCRTTLMYPFGAPSVKCAVCHYITNVTVSIHQLLEAYIFA